MEILKSLTNQDKMEVKYENISDPDGFNKGSYEQLLKKRALFYGVLAGLLPEGKMYYPGSGSDPIPYQAFGERVVYGSLQEAPYYEMFKNEDEAPLAYKDVIAATSNRDKLLAVYADIRNSPFPDSSFIGIILNSIPIEFNGAVIGELQRVLQKGGLLVFEDNEDLKLQESKVYKLESNGFKPHVLDKFQGLSDVKYFGFPNNRPFIFTDENGKRLMSGLKKDEYAQMLKNGENVKMSGHLMRVYKKE